MRELREGKYTAPSGMEIAFQWATTSRDTELKTGTYTFPARDGARVQHQGRGAMTFPLTCVFTGENCMETADAFEALLYERGVGELQHPVYGTFKVKPTGHIAREDDPVTKTGESIVTITFTETISDEEGGELSAVAADSIEALNEAFTEAAAGDFAESIAAVETINEQAAVTTALVTQAQTIIDNLEPLAAVDKQAYADWLASTNELKDSVRNLYKKGMTDTGKSESTFTKALDVARLSLWIMKLPARLKTTLASKIQGYSSLAAALVNQYKNDPYDSKKIKNAFATATIGIAGAVASIASGSAISTAQAAASRGNSSAGAPGASTGASSREEAIETANIVLTLHEKAKAFADSKVLQDAFVDANSESHMALTELVNKSVQLIMNASFSLPMQRTFTLDRDRQVIELCAELYGSPDYLDVFIMQNNFSIDEIELLPMGTKVSYYAESA